MFAARYFPGRYFARRYWPAGAAVAAGGVGDDGGQARQEMLGRKKPPPPQTHVPQLPGCGLPEFRAAAEFGHTLPPPLARPKRKRVKPKPVPPPLHAPATVGAIMAEFAPAGSWRYVTIYERFKAERRRREEAELVMLGVI